MHYNRSIYLLNFIFFLLLIGNYELYIEKEPTLMMSPSTLCKKFRFDGLQQNKTILECREAMLGDTIIVKKTDDGSLYELQPIGKCFSLIHPDDPAKDNFKKWKKILSQLLQGYIVLSWSPVYKT